MVMHLDRIGTLKDLLNVLTQSSQHSIKQKYKHFAALMLSSTFGEVQHTRIVQVPMFTKQFGFCKDHYNDDVAQSTHEEAPSIEAPPLRAPLVEGAAASMACPPLPQSTQPTPPTPSTCHVSR
jgi:hypothetical protein